MIQLDNIKYELFNYTKYKQRIYSLLKDDNLIKMGINYKNVGQTEFGYNIDLITLGTGNKHLFIVGGTHGSEIISVDYVTQLINEIKNMNSFNPNEFTLFFIPLQNPEGFSITTSSLKQIENTFNKSSYEYYLRYRTDDLIVQTISSINTFINTHKNTDSHTFLKEFQIFLNTNSIFKKLTQPNAINNFNKFINKVNKINNISNYQELYNYLSLICTDIINETSNYQNIHNQFLIHLMLILQEYFSNQQINTNIINNRLRLHQQMFKDVSLDTIDNQSLALQVKEIYQQYKHPLGSQVTYDSTGLGINLNANSRLNPGINIIKNNIHNYRLGVRNNIINYTPGPVGTPCLDANNFDYAKENKILYKLIKESYDKGNYIGTLLYHGTGGMIFYKPCSDIMNDNDYQNYLKFNKEISDIYTKSTDYRLIKDYSYTGYGDLLRKTFPGVLMIELSKMGGNPIAPYGDTNNIYNCFNDNYKAFEDLLNYFNNNLNNKKIRKKQF